MTKFYDFAVFYFSQYFGVILMGVASIRQGAFIWEGRQLQHLRQFIFTTERQLNRVSWSYNCENHIHIYKITYNVIILLLSLTIVSPRC